MNYCAPGSPLRERSQTIGISPNSRSALMFCCHPIGSSMVTAVAQDSDRRLRRPV
jgi:hypothetical protein